MAEFTLFGFRVTVSRELVPAAPSIDPEDQRRRNEAMAMFMDNLAIAHGPPTWTTREPRYTTPPESREDE